MLHVTTPSVSQKQSHTAVSGLKLEMIIKLYVATKEPVIYRLLLATKDLYLAETHMLLLNQIGTHMSV